VKLFHLQLTAMVSTIATKYNSCNVSQETNHFLIRSQSLADCICGMFPHTKRSGSRSTLKEIL